MRIKTVFWQQICSIDDFEALENKIDFAQFNSNSYPAILAHLHAKLSLTYEEALLRDALECKLSIQSNERQESEAIKDIDTRCTLIIKHILKGLI